MIQELQPNTSELKALSGNQSLLLSAPWVWVITSGTVAVFAVRIEHGRLAGGRRYLFSCTRGQLLVGSPPERVAGCEYCLLAVGIQDAMLRSISLPQNGSTSAALPDRSTIEIIEGWITNLSNLLPSANGQAPSSPFPLDRQLSLPSEQGFYPQRGSIGWTRVLAGKAWMCGQPEFPLEESDGWIPLTYQCWIEATTQGSVELRFCELWEGPLNNLFHGSLRHLQRMVFTHLNRLELEEVDDAKRRAELRLINERQDTYQALGGLAEVLEKRRGYRRRETDLLSALEPIGSALGVEFVAPNPSHPQPLGTVAIEAITRASRLRARRVHLRGEWWRTDAGPLLAFRADDQSPVALLPSAGGYEQLDPRDDSRQFVSQSLAQQLHPQAISFIRPLPLRVRSLWELGSFGTRRYRPEIGLCLLLAMLTAVAGMCVPPAMQLIIDHAIPGADRALLWQVAAGLLVVAVARTAFSYGQGILVLRILTGMTADVQAATLDRVLRLKSGFFRLYSSGDLTNRTMMVSEISHRMSGTAITGLLTSGMAVLNLLVCLYYSPALAIIAVFASMLSAILLAVLSTAIRKKALELELLGGKLFGLGVQLVQGVSKIRIAGAEQRAFNFWVKRYAHQLRLINAIQRLNDTQQLFNVLMSTLSLAALFYFAAKMLMGSANSPLPILTMGTFLAFHAAFSGLIESTSEFSNSLVGLVDLLAKRKLIQPLLEAEAEINLHRVDPGPLTGAVLVDRVVFRYRNDGPMILNQVTIRADPGEFIALVGPSGSGKSTIFRLLLGFEVPQSGAVLFDGQDLAGIDVAAVRRQIGVVLQQGRINAAPLFDNIASGNVVTLDEAWQAARDAGLDADLERMPMGMHTMVNEGGTNLSGGQRQRLMIARALVMQPKMLLLDEATSALDNRTQQIVSASIKRRRVTRIVVAHRLSTIRDADRIYVIDAGHVVQAGTYDSLSADADGLFARMVARQNV